MFFPRVLRCNIHVYVTSHDGQMLWHCWASVCDVGPAMSQHSAIVSCSVQSNHEVILIVPALKTKSNVWWVIGWTLSSKTWDYRITDPADVIRCRILCFYQVHKSKWLQLKSITYSNQLTLKWVLYTILYTLTSGGSRIWRKGGAPGVLSVCPQHFFVNFSQLRGLFKVFSRK